MERMFIPNKIKSEESSIHKDSNINTKTQKKLFSRDFAKTHKIQFVQILTLLHIFNT